MKTGFYYLSRTDESTAANGFYRSFRKQIDQNFNVSSEAIYADLGNFYSTRREYHLSSPRKTEIFNRLAEVFRNLCNFKGNTEAPLIGDLELEFIDILINNGDQRTINLVGHVGIGKTTFLRYVFSIVRQNCEPLKPYVPLFVNCLGLPTESPKHRDILNQIVRDFRLSELKELVVTPLVTRKEGDADDASSIIDFIASIDSELNKREQKFVVIFDNVDQLSPKSVAMLMILARSAFVNTKAIVILPMRPPTYRTHFETSADKGAFRRYRFDLTPSDFREIVRIRLLRAINEHPDKKVVFPTELVIREPEEFTQKLIDGIFPRDRDQDRARDYLERINNCNIRKALLGFVYFLKWRHLDWQVYAQKRASDAAVRDRKNQRFASLIDGLMKGPYRYFSDRRSEDCPISNVLVFDPEDSDPDFLIQFRILSILDWSGTWVTAKQCIEWLRQIQYEPRFSHACLVRLVARGLIYNPNTETSVDESDQLIISDAGAFYLRRLLYESQYIVNALYDVPLPHVVHQHGRPQLLTKLEMVKSYLDRVLLQEEQQIDNLLAMRRRRLALIGSFKKNGLLSRGVQAIGYQIVFSSRKNSDEDIVQIGKGAGAYFEDLELRISALESKIEERTSTEGRFFRDEPRHRINFSFLGVPGSSLEIPSEFGVGPDQRRVNLVVNAGDNNLKGPLFAIVSFPRRMIPTAVISLTPHPADGEFEGEYVLQLAMTKS